MYAIAFFGVLLMCFSGVMVIAPDKCSAGILEFSTKWYFHAFEIISRILFGAIFIAYAEQTLFPTIMGAFGYVMVAVGVGLLLAGPSRHKHFAVWSAERFKNVFRPAGFASIVVGALIVYGAIKGP